jgi:4-hydroxy-tetrahydrodipicolinate synthase
VITPNGNTGEFYALTSGEQEKVVQLAVAACGEEAIVVAGVGYDVETAVRMGRYAQEQGAVALMVHQPVHPYLSPSGWLAYHQQIAEALPDCGLVPYLRNPAVTGQTLRTLADACPQFVAIKYAVPNPLALAAAKAHLSHDRIAWICGLAELWTPFFWVAGARGFTSGLVNVRTDFSRAILACLQAGDYAGAQAVADTIRPFEELRARHNNALNVSVVKEAMAQLGIGSRTVRPPIRELSPTEQAEVATLLKGWSL